MPNVGGPAGPEKKQGNFNKEELAVRDDMDIYRRYPGWVTDPFGNTRRMNALFDSVLDNMDRDEVGGGAERFTPACDLEETEDHYHLIMDLPGLSKEDIRIDARANQLTVTGDRRREARDSTRGGGRLERRYGRFYRAITLPGEIDTEKVEANYKDGVLELVAPKATDQRPRRVTIGEGKGFFARLKEKVEDAMASEDAKVSPLREENVPRAENRKPTKINPAA